VGFNDLAEREKLALWGKLRPEEYTLVCADRQTVSNRDAIGAKGECFFITD
jgi:hypothetical protein